MQGESVAGDHECAGDVDGVADVVAMGNDTIAVCVGAYYEK